MAPVTCKPRYKLGQHIVSIIKYTDSLYNLLLPGKRDPAIPGVALLDGEDFDLSSSEEERILNNVLKLLEESQ